MSIAEQSAPPLIAGDRLTRAEFMRRWEAQPDIKRAELIGGIVYMPSPVGFEHGDMDGFLGTFVGMYVVATPGTRVSDNATVYLLHDAVQPDIHLRILPEYGGATRVQGQFIFGPPELVIEICHSSTAYDLHQKLDLYQEAGVKEYLAILLHEQEIRWHHLTDKGYQLLVPGADGVMRSLAFPGLWLAGKALLQENMGEVLATLNRGLQTAEHAKFVAELAGKKSS